VIACLPSLRPYLGEAWRSRHDLSNEKANHLGSKKTEDSKGDNQEAGHILYNPISVDVEVDESKRPRGTDIELLELS
jgi:hypothetical protein